MHTKVHKLSNSSTFRSFKPSKFEAFNLQPLKLSNLRVQTTSLGTPFLNIAEVDDKAGKDLDKFGMDSSEVHDVKTMSFFAYAWTEYTMHR